jgi:hypothetical protein
VAELADRQFELDGYVFGPGAPVEVSVVDFGSPEIRQHDTPLPRGDGTRFGRDYRDGRLVTFELATNQDGGDTALAALSALQRAWLADPVRSAPGAVSVLRYRVAGRTRRVYGRPRRFAADSRLYRSGRVDVTCDFQCVDHLFYDDVEFSTSISIAPPATGGLVEPLTDPLTATAATAGQGEVVVAGDAPAWLVARINGPILDPVVEVVGVWSARLRVDLASDEWITVDSTLWNRGVLRNGAVNAAGIFTQDSPRLSQWRLPTGQHEMVLRGVDGTGTAALLASWRTKHSSY